MKPDRGEKKLEKTEKKKEKTSRDGLARSRIINEERSKRKGEHSREEGRDRREEAESPFAVICARSTAGRNPAEVERAILRKVIAGCDGESALTYRYLFPRVPFPTAVHKGYELRPRCIVSRGPFPGETHLGCSPERLTGARNVCSGAASPGSTSILSRRKNRKDSLHSDTKGTIKIT